MTQFVYPGLHALFIWWFSTGVVIFLDGLPPRSFRYSMAGATVVLGLGLYGLAASASDRSVGGVYLAFTSALLIWSWLEASFYLGYVTGVRRHSCVAGCHGWRHFGHAIAASLWHELAVLVLGGVVLALGWGAENPFGAYTFVVLWWMHQSARLNVFLGVRNLNLEFLPEHLFYLRGFFRNKPMNLLFPISVSVSTVLAAWLFQRAAVSGDPVAVIGNSVVGTMMVLAIAEHWFLVLPLPTARLWSWGLRSRPDARPAGVQIVGGCLGAGKTSFICHQLDLADPGSRTLVIVDEPGEISVDRSILARRGATVVALGEGGFRCGPDADLAGRLREIIARHRPDRVLIEPGGNADIGAVCAAFEDPRVRPLVRRYEVIALIDAACFVQDYAGAHRLLTAQARLAGNILLNKADLIDAGDLAVVRDTLHQINPGAAIIAARFGAVPPGALVLAQANPPTVVAAEPEHDAGMMSWSNLLSGRCALDELRQLLELATEGLFGDVERLKGLAPCGAGWLRFDIAAGRAAITAFAAAPDEQARVAVMGRHLDAVALDRAFSSCIVAGA